MPIGAYTGPVGSPEHTPAPEWTVHGRGVYVEELVRNAPGASPRSAADAPSALSVYRDALKARADASVVVVCVGHLTNLLDLLEDDEGKKLLAAKVLPVIGRVLGPGLTHQLWSEHPPSRLRRSGWW